MPPYGNNIVMALNKRSYQCKKYESPITFKLQKLNSQGTSVSKNGQTGHDSQILVPKKGIHM
jgi:hypothetical protein